MVNTLPVDSTFSFHFMSSMSDSERTQCFVLPLRPACPRVFACIRRVCVSFTALSGLRRQSQSVKSPLVSGEACVSSLFKRLWHQTAGIQRSHAKARSQTALPPGKFSPDEHLAWSNLTSFSRRGRLAPIPVPHILKPHFKSIQGFSFNAATVFVVVSYRSGEAEGWLPQASNKIFNELGLQGKV